MRKSLILFPLLLTATPALAQAGPSQRDIAEAQRVLADPAMANRLTNVVQALSNALLNLPAGEVQAAIEGRPATPAERRMTVRDIARRDDPNFDRDFQRQVAEAGPMVRQSMKALGTALPEMMQGLHQAQKALQRAAANMPDPNYPKR
jgi:hypothetical protein